MRSFLKGREEKKKVTLKRGAPSPVIILAKRKGLFFIFSLSCLFPKLFAFQFVVLVFTNPHHQVITTHFHHRLNNVFGFDGTRKPKKGLQKCENILIHSLSLMVP